MFRVLSGFIRLYLIISLVRQTCSKFEFTNLKCTSLDESVATFEYCILKSVNRTYKYGSLKVNLHQGPIHKVKVNMAIYKRLNGFKPFLYNVTVDVCKLVKNPSIYPVAGFMYNFFGPFSNFNHSCPLDTNIIVDKVPTSHVNNQLTKILPFPTGEYGFYSIWYFYGIKIATVNVYGTLS